MSHLEVLRRLAVALSLGLLIGLERGWQQRERGEGRRFAGFRTFGIVSLLGAVATLLLPDSPVVLAGAFVGLGLVCAVGYWRTSAEHADLSATTAIAALLTFALGALAGQGRLVPATSAAVVIALLLGFKPELHSIVQRIERQELLATLRLLLISVVLLPILPDRGYGPWQALNPYRIWWMVVLVAGISYVGYFAIKLMGNRLGLLVTGLAGGLASSSATAVELAHQATRDVKSQGSLAGAIVVASAIMFPRMLIVSAVNPAMILRLAPPLLSAGAVALTVGIIYLRRSPASTSGQQSPQLRARNPLDLATAVQFGLLLAMIMLLVHATLAFAGNRGLLLLSAVSALADVDAITLSLASMASQGRASARVAITGIFIAATVNSLVKPVVVTFIGGRKMGLRVAWPMLLAIAAGALALEISRS